MLQINQGANGGSRAFKQVRPCIVSPAFKSTKAQGLNSREVHTVCMYGWYLGSLA